MKELKIIATIVTKSDTKEEVLNACKNVVDGTRTECGNISYALHIDTSNPLKLVILEHWKNQEAIDLHNQTEHFNTFIASIKELVESVEITTLEMVY